jgi:nucleosome binding factor SPN SPT16 subunit
LLLHRGTLNDDDPFQKSSTLHLWLFGYELPDTIFLLRKDGSCWFLATKKKCDFLKQAAENVPEKSGIQEIHMLLRSKEDGNAASYEELLKEACSGVVTKNGDDENGAKTLPALGLILKERTANSEGGGIVGPWEQKLTAAAEGDDATVKVVDVTNGLAFAIAIKDDIELDLMKKSSVLSNKVMKHGYVKKMEEVIDSEKAMTNDELATFVDEILEDPSKIALKVPKEDVQPCYFPIVQSGGTYDLKVSAQSTTDTLKHDIIMVSLGARYKNYCSNISRTFFVDPPKKVSGTYEVLMEMQDACLEVMKPGNQLKAVYKAAVAFLQERSGYEYLVDHLPKSLGYATGLDFRESAFSLTAKNPASFKKGMVFCLSLGFQNLDLSEPDLAATPDKSPVSLFVTSVVCVSCSFCWMPGFESQCLTLFPVSSCFCLYCRSRNYPRMLFLSRTCSPLPAVHPMS